MFSYVTVITCPAVHMLCPQQTVVKVNVDEEVIDSSSHRCLGYSHPPVRQKPPRVSYITDQAMGIITCVKVNTFRVRLA